MSVGPRLQGRVSPLTGIEAQFVVAYIVYTVPSKAMAPCACPGSGSGRKKTLDLLDLEKLSMQSPKSALIEIFHPDERSARQTKATAPSIKLFKMIWFKQKVVLMPVWLERAALARVLAWPIPGHGPGCCLLCVLTQQPFVKKYYARSFIVVHFYVLCVAKEGAPFRGT